MVLQVSIACFLCPKSVYLHNKQKITKVMPEKIITLATLTYMRAQLLCAMLESNGIECFMTNINRMKESAGGVHVKIQSEDAEKAMKIFEDFRASYGVNKEEAVAYMKSIRRILVPVDFSVHAENAAFYALKIAESLKADIKLMNAYLDPTGTPQTYLESYSYQLNLDKIIHEVEEETEKSLRSLSCRLKDKIENKGIKDVMISFDLFKGNATDAILNQVREYDPAMIIMGTRGNKLEGIRTYGSTTAQVIRKANIPVLAVPQNYDASAVDKPKKVLYATNFDKTDYKALRRLSSFAKPFNAKIYCVHAALDDDNEIDEIEMKKVRSYLVDTMQESNIECGILETTDMQQGFENFIKEKKIDMLAVTTTKRNFIEKLYKPSIAKKFLFHSSIPMLVFQARP
jgi:nucleotide-binding universal stress UspA family protein